MTHHLLFNLLDELSARRRRIASSSRGDSFFGSRKTKRSIPTYYLVHYKPTKTTLRTDTNEMRLYPRPLSGRPIPAASSASSCPCGLPSVRKRFTARLYSFVFMCDANPSALENRRPVATAK